MIRRFLSIIAMKRCRLSTLVLAVLLIILVCLLATILVTRRVSTAAAKHGTPTTEASSTVVERLAKPFHPFLLGGAAQTRKARALKSENLVVDTLNLTHWLKRRTPLKRVETCDILAAIERTAPILRSCYPGRIIYVTKNRETRAAKVDSERLRALYQAIARRCNVYVNVVERLPGEEDEPDTLRRQKGKSHASLGRDDFYLIMLAWKYNCPVLSRDRFRDLAGMKADLDPFHVYLFSPVKLMPERDFVNPAAAEFRKMGRPASVDYPEVLSHL
jgi:hypothetical protein